MPSPQYIREIFSSELGFEPNDAAIQWYMTRGLEGDQLARAILADAGRDYSDIYNDPTYSAYARAQRNARTQIMRNREAETAQIQRQRGLANRGFDRLQERRLEDVDTDFSQRGMLRAGRRLLDRADVTRDVQLQRQQSELSFADRTADTNRDAADRLSRISRDQDEQRIAARNRLTDRSLR